MNKNDIIIIFIFILILGVGLYSAHKFEKDTTDNAQKEYDNLIRPTLIVDLNNITSTKERIKIISEDCKTFDVITKSIGVRGCFNRASSEFLNITN